MEQEKKQFSPKIQRIYLVAGIVITGIFLLILLMDRTAVREEAYPEWYSGRKNANSIRNEKDAYEELITLIADYRKQTRVLIPYRNSIRGAGSEEEKKEEDAGSVKIPTGGTSGSDYWNSSSSSKPSKKPGDVYGASDYYDAEDFADDWDDAYDYWEDEMN